MNDIVDLYHHKRIYSNFLPWRFNEWGNDLTDEWLCAWKNIDVDTSVEEVATMDKFPSS